MSNGLKIFLIIIVILSVIAVFAFMWGKSAWDKINFSYPKPQAINLQGLSWTDLPSIALGSGKEVSVTLSMDVKNDNNFSIPFSNMKVKMFYENVLIAETSDALAAQKFVIPANGTLSVSDTVNIILNASGIKFLIDKGKGGHPKIDYSISLRVFGIPLPSISNDFTW